MKNILIVLLLIGTNLIGQEIIGWSKSSRYDIQKSSNTIDPNLNTTKLVINHYQESLQSRQTAVLIPDLFQKRKLLLVYQGMALK